MTKCVELSKHYYIKLCSVTEYLNLNTLFRGNEHVTWGVEQKGACTAVEKNSNSKVGEDGKTITGNYCVP